MCAQRIISLPSYVRETGREQSKELTAGRLKGISSLSVAAGRKAGAPRVSNQPPQRRPELSRALQNIEKKFAVSVTFCDMPCSFPPGEGNPFLDPARRPNPQPAVPVAWIKRIALL